MNVALLFKVVDTAMAIRDVARRFTKAEPAAQDAAAGLAQPSASGGAIETRLASVVVAALKEAFDRDHARLDLERAHLQALERRAEDERRRAEDERRRADEALRLERRRQAADRELGRLRFLAGTALVGWIASVTLLLARASDMSLAGKAAVAMSWLLLLAALAAAFTAQSRIGALAADPDRPLEVGGLATAALWMLIGGLGAAAASLLL